MKTDRKTILGLACLAALVIGLGCCWAPTPALATAAPWNSLDAIDGQTPSPNSLDGVGAGWARSEDFDFRYIASTIGDSLTDSEHLQGVFYSRLNDPGFPFRSIPGPTQVYRHGLPGGETGSILNMVRQQDLGAGEGANFVVIMAGTNDIDYSRGAPLAELATAMVANVQAIVDDVLGGNHDPAVRPSVIVSGMPPYLDPDLTAEAKYYNNLLRTTLKRVDVFTDATWWDLYDPSTGAAARDLMDDFKHPNGDGMYRIAENWFEGVDSLFNPKRFSQDAHIYKMDYYHQLH